MSAAAIPPDTHYRYLVRVQDSDIVFAPIKNPPDNRNFFYLETCEHYKFSSEEKKFVPYLAEATLYRKHGETVQELQKFRAKDNPSVLDKVAERIARHYLQLK